VSAGAASSSAQANPAVHETSGTEPGNALEARPEQSRTSRLRVRNRGAVALEAQATDEFSSGDYERAAATLERAIRLDPEDARLWIALGDVRLAQGRPSLAESLGLKAVALSSPDPQQQSEARQLVARARNDL
jgi:Flp pilus assembly protein TadD